MRHGLLNLDLVDEMLNGFGFPSQLEVHKFFDNKVSFPYFDVEKEGNKITYAFALAGYAKDCLEVYTDNGRLKIKGSKKNKEKDKVEYLYKGLTEKNIDVEIPLPFGNRYISQKASFKDGVLRVTFDLDLKDTPNTKLKIS